MSTRVRRGLGLAALAATLGVAGACTNDAADTSARTTPTPEATEAATVKACVLVTGADAATALGLPAPLTPKTDSPEACEYEAPNAVDTVAIDVEPQAYSAGTEDLVISMVGQDKAKKVSGLGDAAFSFTVESQVQYHVWAKGRYLLVVVTKTGTPPPDASAKTLATQAVSRL
jgi:hypothetical protein